ncbi:MAG: O-antigen ligase family protein [bacterium]|nr:O-antigen ligase family protein [bacterium]
MNAVPQPRVRPSEWLLAAVVFLLPWQARFLWSSRQLNGAFWEYGSFSLYALELVVWACLIFALARLLATRGASAPFFWRRWATPKGAVVAGAAGLVLWSWFSIAWAQDRSLALQAAFRLTEGVALLIVLARSSRRGRSLAGQAWALAAAAQGIVAAAQFFTQQVAGSTWLGVDPQLPSELGASVIELTDGRWLRAYGTFPHPNILAGFLVIGILISGEWYLRQYRSAQRIFAVACGMVASVGLAFALSRAGIAAAALGLAVWLFSCGARRHSLVPPLRFSLAVGITAATALTIMWPLVATRAVAAARLEVKSTQERGMLLREGALLAREHLWTGTGIGQTTLSSYRRNPGQPGWAYQPPHNVALVALVELGVDGVLLLLLLLAGTAFRAVQNPGSAGIGMVAALVVVAWFDHYLWTLLPGTLMACLALGFASGDPPSDRG